jgi:hypothetical protein
MASLCNNETPRQYGNPARNGVTMKPAKFIKYNNGEHSQIVVVPQFRLQ